MNLQEAALYLLESGKMPENCSYSYKELVIAMQDLADPDPWLDEPLTLKELEVFNEK